MSKWPILAGLAVTVMLGACSSHGPDQAYTSPGWYLEKPRLLMVSGPEIFAGPFSYDACEAERLKYSSAPQLLCINEKMKPGPYGPYTSTPSPAAPSS